MQLSSIGKRHSAFLYRSTFWLVLNIMLASLLNQPTVINHNLLTTFNLISYILCIYHWMKSGGNFLSLYVFFILYTALCNLGQSMLYLFSVPQEFLPLYSVVDFKWIYEEVRFQSMCTAALNMGTVLYVYKTSRVASLAERREAYTNLSPKRKGNFSIFEILLIICLVYVAINTITMINLRQTMSYADFFEEGRGETRNFLTGWIKYGAIALPLWALFTKRNTNFVYGALGFFIMGLMLVGARGLAIRYIAIVIITLPVIYPNLFKKKLTIVWMVLAFFSFSFLSVISTARKDSLSDGVFVSSNTIGYNALATISEIGGSARPAALTIQANSGETPHYQTILVSAVRAVIPFSSYLAIVQQQNIHLGDWVTDYAGSFWSGLGYSNIGETYMNYAWYGWMFMLFYGWFIAYAENTAYRRILNRKYLYAIVLLSVLTVHLVWARGQMSDYVGIWRSSIYILIIGYILKLGNKRISL